MLATERPIFKQALRSCYLHARSTIVGDAMIDFRDVRKYLLQQKLLSLLHSNLSLKLCLLTVRKISRNHFHVADTSQKMKFFIKDFFSKCDQIRSFLQIWSHLLKKSSMENFIFYVV